MDAFVDLIVSFPVVIFTALLAFSLAWWLVSMVAGGFDVDGSFEVDGGLDTDVGADGDGGFGDTIADALGVPGIPISVSFSVIAFGGWVASIVGTSMFRMFDIVGMAAILISGIVVAVAILSGLQLARLVAKPLAPLFITLVAASVDDAIGSHGRVRSIVLDGARGEVLVIDGPVRSTVLNARAAKTYKSGDIVHIVGRDDDGHYIVQDVDPALLDPLDD